MEDSNSQNSVKESEDKDSLELNLFDEMEKEKNVFEELENERSLFEEIEREKSLFGEEEKEKDLFEEELKNLSQEQEKDSHQEEINDVPNEEVNNLPNEGRKDLPNEEPKDTRIEEPIDTLNEEPKDTPNEEPKDIPNKELENLSNENLNGSLSEEKNNFLFEKEKKAPEPLARIKRTVESMLEQMKMTDEESKYRLENFDSVDVVKKYLQFLKCTKCERNFLNALKKGRKVYVHPLLKVLMCKPCCEYYGDGNFSMDSEGEDKYCRWCGEGGTIFGCSKCICAFCDKCIKKHFGKEGLEKIKNDDDWACYFCDPKPLWYLRSICSLAEQTAQNKKEQLEKRRTEKIKDLTTLNMDSSSESHKTLDSDTPVRKLKRKKFSKNRSSTSDNSSKHGFSSSEDKEENRFNKIKLRPKTSKRLSERIQNKAKKNHSLSTPKKKLKMANSSSNDEEDCSFVEKKNQVLEKLRGIWKLTQIVAETGLNSSKQRLKLLNNANNFKTMESLQNEYSELESLMCVMSSSLNSARNSVESVTKHFNFENMEDDRDVFQSQETKLKSIAKELQESSDKVVENSRGSLPQDHMDTDGYSSENIKKKKKGRPPKNSPKKKKRKRNDSNYEAVENDINSDESDKSSISGDKKQEENSKESIVIKDVKVMLQKLDNNKENSEGGNDIKEVREEKFKESNENSKEVDEYNADTETDTEQDSVKKKKNKKKKESSGSNFEGDENDEDDKKVTERTKKWKKKIKSNFDKFKEKRKKYLQSVSSKHNDKSETEKEIDKKDSKEDSQKCLEEKIDFNEEVKENSCEEKTSGKENSLNKNGSDSEASKSDDVTLKSTNKKSKKQRKLIIASSDEENENKAEGSQDEKKSEESSKSEEENKKNTSDFSEGSMKISSDENSSDEISKKKNKYKRIRKKNKGESSSEEIESYKKNKKKNKDLSSSEQSDDEGNKKKKGRKNIKKILKKESLHVETKEALKNEEDRKERIEARKKQFQELFPEDKENPDASKRLILDFDPETKEPLVSVHTKLVKKLKPHQREGVRFMWDNCFESVKKLEEDSGSGCILAHCMGLGKTLQVVTLVHTVMTHDLGVNTVLIVCPLSTVSNWINEFEMWLANIHTEPITLYDLVKYKKMEERCYHLKDWQENGGVLVISYDLFRTLIKNLLKKTKKIKKAVKTIESALADPGPDLVICDEGHLLKNEDTALSKCINLIKTSRRIVLTGTPLQNNLMEYHCMVQFVKPNILGTKKEFSNRFVNPINNGQFEDSTELDVKIMKRRSHVLHSMLSGCIQRFDYSVLTPFLPEKYEYVLTIALTETQAKAYRHFISNLSAKATGGSKTASLFNDYHNLQRIWTHPKVLLMHLEKEVPKEEYDSEGSLKDFVVNTDESSTESSGSNSVEDITPTPVRKRVLRSNANDPEVQAAVEEEEKSLTKHWWDDFFKEDEFEDIRASNKLVILFTLLKQAGEMKDKVLVFSQSLYSLDLIEYFLNKIDEACDKEDDESLGAFKDSWVRGVDYFRLDGSTNSETRSIWCKHFNKESNTRARLFLISTRAGGLGINLFGANRVILFDASWNPSHDLQSIFRVYRFGQKKTCYIYRFLAEATMEEKIYERQVTKLSLAHRVVDEYQIERHYSMMNLQELYNYEPIPPEKRKIPKLPKDTVFADLFTAHKDKIVTYHEHDSLLENQEEEELSEEERKAAWKEYEDEKVQKIKAFDQTAFQQQLQMAAALSQAQNIMFQGAVPQFLQNFDNSYAQAMNTAWLNLNQPIAGQSYVNPPLVRQSIIPGSLLQRGIQLGITPFANESAEEYLNRIKLRERWMQGPRET